LFLDSLETNPSYWCRALKSGRYAATRVFKGSQDDQDRATLLLVTAILTPDEWVRCLHGSPGTLMRLYPLWAWGGESVIASFSCRIVREPEHTPSQEERLLALSILRSIEALYPQPDVSLVLSEEECPPAVLDLVASIMPDYIKPTFSLAVRSLTDGLAVGANCLGKGASRGRSTRRTVRFSPMPAALDSPYADDLAARWQPGEPPPRDFISSCRYFCRRPAKPTPKIPARETQEEPILLLESVRTSREEPFPIPHAGVFRRRSAWNRVAQVGLVAAAVVAFAFGLWFLRERLRSRDGLAGISKLVPESSDRSVPKVSRGFLAESRKPADSDAKRDQATPAGRQGGTAQDPEASMASGGEASESVVGTGGSQAKRSTTTAATATGPTSRMVATEKTAILREAPSSQNMMSDPSQRAKQDPNTSILRQSVGADRNGESQIKKLPRQVKDGGIEK